MPTANTTRACERSSAPPHSHEHMPTYTHAPMLLRPAHEHSSYFDSSSIASDSSLESSASASALVRPRSGGLGPAGSAAWRRPRLLLILVICVVVVLLVSAPSYVQSIIGLFIASFFSAVAGTPAPAPSLTLSRTPPSKGAAMPGASRA